MFTSADLIEALRRRRRRSLRPERPAGEFPPGWQAWLDALATRLGRVTGAAAEAFVALLLERQPLPPPPRMAGLGRWQAFATLWRQEWQPASREGRGLRITAMAITFVFHLLVAVLLLWAAMVRYPLPAPAGEDVIQVEYIGAGTPEDTGGAAPGANAPADTAAPASGAQQAPRPPAEIAAPVQAAAPQAPEAAPAPAPSVAEIPQPEPPVSAPVPAELRVPEPVLAQPAVQPLQVTEVEVPDTDFVLPPPTPLTAEVPRLQPRELQAEVREIEAIERSAPPVETLRPQLATGRLAAPSLRPDVAPVLPEVRARSVELPVARAPELRAPTRAVELREPAPPTAAPASAPAATAATTVEAPASAALPSAATASPASSAPAAAAGPARTAPAPGGTTPGANAPAGAGPDSTRPGAWPSPRRDDDWGASTRERPGGRAGQPGGLFDGDGSPRLPPGTAAPGGGLPPGTLTQDIPNLDRAGTWLKRPPIGYTPSRWDQFWIPNETLLEEWVRRNIRSVEIPIPGSTKKLRCVVSLLQLGGGCGITDPNLQDQEAEARPPPDVPFKPELQEDQGALREPVTGNR